MNKGVIIVFVFVFVCSFAFAEDRVTVVFVNGGSNGDGNVDNTTPLIINACLQIFSSDSDIKTQISHHGFSEKNGNNGEYEVTVTYSGRYSKGVVGFIVTDVAKDEIIFAYNTILMKRKDIMNNSTYIARDFYRLFRKKIIEQE